MPECLRCHAYYREPPDEQGEHPCPSCGYYWGEDQELDEELVAASQDRRRSGPNENMAIDVEMDAANEAARQSMCDGDGGLC